jgi:chorismate mutase/prephenate dehydratase
VNDKSKLDDLRKRIDALDEKLLELISDRARLAIEVGKYKTESGSEVHYRPEREAQVLQNVLKRNQGPLTDEEMARLFREVMSACLALESPLTIAFLGPEGTFTQEAAFKHFGHSVTTQSFSAIDEVFRDVEAGNSQFGVVPIENSTEGVVNHTLDMFLHSDLRICGEVSLRVHHHLLSKAGDVSEIKKIVSHQQSLAQCREWLDANLPGVEREPTSSNAEAARLAGEDRSIAAIAGESAGKIYGLGKLAANIEDEPDNTTRFLVIGRLQTRPSGNDKTSLVVSGKNKPGALYELLSPLASRGINMTRIESRPSRLARWEYVFFLDVLGHADEEKVQEALAALKQEAAFFKLLGSYPISVL